MAGTGDKKTSPDGGVGRVEDIPERDPKATVSAPPSGSSSEVSASKKPAKATAGRAKRAVKSKAEPAEHEIPQGGTQGARVAKAVSATKVSGGRPEKKPTASTSRPVARRQAAAAASPAAPVDTVNKRRAANRSLGRTGARKAASTTSPKPVAVAAQKAHAAVNPMPAPDLTPQPVVAPKSLGSRPNRASQAAHGPDHLSFAEAAFGPHSTLPTQLSRNIERIEALTQRLFAALSQRRNVNPGIEAPGPEVFANVAGAWLKLMAEQPARVIGQQASYWGETLRHFAEAQAEFTRGTLTAPPDDGPSDRRFANPLWENHPFFNFVKRQYQINAQAMQQAAADLDIEDQIARRRIDWLTRQMIDMMAPTNFLATNPDALEKAFATEGESLVQGLENLVRDVELHSGDVIVTLADRKAFRIGENLATTAGTVVARTKLYELIQYAPSTPQVHALPVVIFPPWINKFYILDLKPQNSLIKWIVDQGFTVFVVAWKNPDASYAQTGLDDYVSAYLDVMDRVQDLTGQEQLNAVGYCIAGTTLALTLALLKQRQDDRVNSATFFTTLTDFSEQGEFTTFLQEDFVSGIESEVKAQGILPGSLMQRTFSFLRANDLVWGPAIRSYMLGEAPPAFDLLFWNGDSTNLPGLMAMDYLRGLCQQNAFATDGFKVLGQVVRLSDVTLPLCAIACEADHIAPWKDSWRGIAAMGSADRSFILSQSGHIAGIINPPSKKKYGHYTSDSGFEGESDDWLQAARFHEGSWWQRWGDWLAARSGDQVAPPEAGQGFGPAPGRFVHE